MHLLLSKASDFPGGSDSKASAYNAGDLGSIPGLHGIFHARVLEWGAIAFSVGKYLGKDKSVELNLRVN